jgi:hypothetical protein
LGPGVPSGARSLAQPSGPAVLGVLPQLVWTQSMPRPPWVKSLPLRDAPYPTRDGLCQR